MAAAKSIRTEPRSQAVEGAWRIRTAVCAPSASYEYDRLRDPEALQALRADRQSVPGSRYRGETERVRRAAAPPARSVSVHPIHTAGRYFACHDPEGQWIADMEAAASSGEEPSPRTRSD